MTRYSNTMIAGLMALLLFTAVVGLPASCIAPGCISMSGHQMAMGSDTFIHCTHGATPSQPITTSAPSTTVDLATAVAEVAPPTPAASPVAAPVGDLLRPADQAAVSRLRI